MKGHLLFKISQLDKNLAHSITWTYWETLEDAWLSLCLQAGTELGEEQCDAFLQTQSLQAKELLRFSAVPVEDDAGEWLYLQLGVVRESYNEARFKVNFKPRFFAKRSQAFVALSRAAPVNAEDANAVSNAESQVVLNKNEHRFVLYKLPEPGSK